MSYTDYGLAEGLTMIISPLVVFTLMYIVMMYKAPTPYKKRNTLLYSLVLILLALDTAWWAFDIQTGVIDVLVKRDNGTEQLTVFNFMMYGLILYMALSRPKTVTDPESKEGEN